jgi:MFS family permease
MVVSVLALLLGANGVVPAVMLLCAAAALAAFLWIEARAPEPILSLALMRRPVIATSSTASALLGALMMGTLIYVPLYVQAVLGGSPTEAGMTVAPMLVGWPLASLTSGHLVKRFAMHPMVRIGTLIAACASFTMSWLLQPAASLLALECAMFFFGVGLGTSNNALLLAVQQAVTWEQRGVATASAMFFRSIGGALAAGALGAILARTLGPDVPIALINQLLGPTHGRDLDPALIRPLASSLSHALHAVFIALAVISAAAVLAGFAFPKLPKPQPRPTEFAPRASSD